LAGLGVACQRFHGPLGPLERQVEGEPSPACCLAACRRRDPRLTHCRRTERFAIRLPAGLNGGERQSIQLAPPPAGSWRRQSADDLLRDHVSHADWTTTQQPLERRIDGCEFTLSARNVEAQHHARRAIRRSTRGHLRPQLLGARAGRSWPPSPARRSRLRVRDRAERPRRCVPPWIGRPSSLATRGTCWKNGSTASQTAMSERVPRCGRVSALIKPDERTAALQREGSKSPHPGRVEFGRESQPGDLRRTFGFVAARPASFMSRP